MAKKEFKWDNETVIGTVEVSEKEKREICSCELNGKLFISIKKIVFAKGEWKIVANFTCPENAFQQIGFMVNNYFNTPEEVK